MGKGKAPRHRIPCVVEGCRRTVSSKFKYAETICGKHWKLVPSKMKRVLRRINRQARRYGWTPAQREREWRIWCRIKRAVADRAEGAIDVAEINALFGWSDSA